MNEARTNGASAVKPIAVLLNLSGDKNEAMAWVMSRHPDSEIKPIDKVDLKWTSKAQALKAVRALKPDSFSVFTSDLKAQSGLGGLMLFGTLAGARRVEIGDPQGRKLSRSRLSVLLLDAPGFALELLAGYGAIIPFSWMVTEALAISLAFRRVVRASRGRNAIASDGPRPLRALYVRATLPSGSEGGMLTHAAGFASGAASLGHRLKFLVCGVDRYDDDAIVIQPSRAFGATRVLFELWNNLFFTPGSAGILPARRSNEFDFIYQRYSRFNWTGAALSILTGLPLALEFNGSEVWVAKQWDPIGQLWLLKRFEVLNQRAANLIFVVSDAERRNLIAAGVSPAKIVVNPNGVDTDEFRPGCGGSEIRRSLGVKEKVVVGFIGTFGPWHGAPVLAEAAHSVSPLASCHFLFIGDGEQRAQTESVINAADVSATFTGRVSHEKVPAYLDACDILVAPNVAPADGTEFFGSPTKLFEYMAMAKAVVASRLGQIADVIDDGENGILVEPGDASAIAHAIERLAKDEGLRARLGSAAQEKVVGRYTWKHNAARVFEAMRGMDHG